MRGRVLCRQFKLDVVRQLARGARKPAQACREYGVAESLLLRWRKEYEERAGQAFTPKQPPETEAFNAKIAELEQHGGRLSFKLAVVK